MPDEDEIRQNELQNDQLTQSYRDKVEKLLNDYLIQNGKERLLQTLKFMNTQSTDYHSQQLQQQQITYYHRFVNQFVKILNQPLLFKQQQLSNEQQEKLSTLIKSYESKIYIQIISFMRKNSLLQSIKNSKLEQIARSYTIYVLPKNQCLQFRTDQPQKISLYYLLHGDVQKIRYYTFCGNKEIGKSNQSFSLKKAIDKLHQRSVSYKEELKDSEEEDNSNNQKKLKNLSVSLKVPPISNRYSVKSFVNQRKSFSRNILRTLIQNGQFIGDEFFSNTDPDHVFPTMAKFLITSQKAVLIHFSGDLIKKILDYYNYVEESKSFYEEKSYIQLKQIQSMRLFDKRFKKLCKQDEQSRLKKNCSPQLEDMKKYILKRYITSNSVSQVDTNSPKQLSKILSKRRKKMNINRKNNFQLPIVEVFATHSQKKRSHDSVALAPMAIVKTKKNKELLSKPDSIISKGEKSEIYQIKSWQSATDLTNQQNLPPALKQLHEVVKHKKRINGGFELLQIDRVLQKIKVNLKKK